MGSLVNWSITSLESLRSQVSRWMGSGEYDTFFEKLYYSLVFFQRPMYFIVFIDEETRERLESPTIYDIFKLVEHTFSPQMELEIDIDFYQQ